ncbi:MAG: dihydropteroate synthase [Prevotella sp.]|nr:dihydropteroate synthase [Prevotella sp.]
MDYTLNIRGRLMSLAQPVVMGILNVTPDSFYADSRMQNEAEVARRARQIVDEGAAIIDIGACSTRPGAELATQQQEMERLRMALGVVRHELPDAVLSVDTFRSDVARMAVEEYGVDIINDVGTPHLSPPTSRLPMLRIVSRLHVPYVLMSSEATLEKTLLFFADQVQQLRDMGHKDIVLDPGFGFGKTVEQNYALLASMEKLLVMEYPLLVGISRKSMIYRLLGITPDESLNGTTALHAVALMKGASILRVHDVKEAVECCKLMAALNINRKSVNR